MKFLISFFLALVLTLSGWDIARSQPGSTGINLPLGGGGTAYINGYEANFMNPANLMIRTRQTDFSAGIGGVGFFYEPVLPVENIEGLAGSFAGYFRAYELPTGSLTQGEIDDIINLNYKARRLFSEHQHRSDLVLGGFQWQGEDQSFSISSRIRSATRVEVGRGWYDTAFIERGNSPAPLRDMRLVQQSSSLFEISVGVARTFDFITGLIPKLGTLYIGIAPKFVMSGSYIDLQYHAKYLEQTGEAPLLVQSMDYLSTGIYTSATRSYVLTEDPGLAVSEHFSSSSKSNINQAFRPTGYGAGFDFGLTYVLSLGGSAGSSLSDAATVSGNSIRLGFSVTDLGFLSYTKRPLHLSRETDSLSTTPVSRVMYPYEGAPGQYLFFFDETDPDLNPLSGAAGGGDTGTFTTVLPTSINTGMLLKINQFRLAADIILGLNDTAFDNTKLTGHFGLEFYPVSIIPVRVGSRVAAGDPTLFTLGTGVEMAHWELSAGLQFSTRGTSSTTRVTGIGLGGLKFHF